MLPPFVSARDQIRWWETWGNTKVVSLIKNGVKPLWQTPPVLPILPCHRDQHQEEQATKVLREYLEVGAVKVFSPIDTKFLVPWFVIAKHDTGKEKLRLIADCRLLNRHLQTKRFHLDQWK